MTWGKEGTENGSFNSPSRMSFVNDRVYVADTDNHRVQVFTILEHLPNYQTDLDNIKCKKEFELIFKYDNSPACVTPDTKID